jgi:iron complex outermembrane receptor protein
VTRHIEVSAEVKNLLNNRAEYVYYDPTTASALHSPNDARAVYASMRLTY